MPNWCSNKLSVSGPSSVVDRFVKENEGDAGEPLSFNKAALTPPELLEGEGWYDWRVTTWGTKWDLDQATGRNVRLGPHAGAVIYDFSSAWSPPTGWLRIVAARYPQLRFRLDYIEEGNCFAGRVKCKEGRVMEGTTLDFKTAYIAWYGKDAWTDLMNETGDS